MELKDNDGGVRKGKAMVDDGSGVGGMNRAEWLKAREVIKGWSPSSKEFRMANGSIVPGDASWNGKVCVDGLEVDAGFEVFDSGGSWDYLFGKPLLERFKAVHDYGENSLRIEDDRKQSRKLFNTGLGRPLEKGTEAKRQVEEDQPVLPSSAVVVQSGLEESERLAGGVGVESQAPLYREVAADFVVNPETSSNTRRQYDPGERRYPKPTVEEVEDEDQKPRAGCTQEANVESQPVPPVRDGRCRAPAATVEEAEDEDRIRERMQREWCRLEEEFANARREEAKVLQERLTKEREERKRRNDEEERKRDKEWKEWVRQRWAGPGARRWHRWATRGEELPPLRRTRANSSGGTDAPPSREVQHESEPPERTQVDNSIPETHRKEIAPVCVVGDYEEAESGFEADFIPEALDGTSDETLFTRNVGPDGAFRPKRVAEVLKQVTIGEDLTGEQRGKVERLLMDYADCFALSVGEVRHVEGAVHRLNIPEGASFSRKVRQKGLTPPQREYLHAKVDELVAAGVLERCSPEEVKCVSPLKLAKKAHEGQGLSVEELKRKLNAECVAAGLPESFDISQAPDLPEQSYGDAPPAKQKWRICQNFGEVNKLTEIAPMPQGDIRAKQQTLSGHRYICLFDFASGFYTVDVAQESRPYTAFYVEGKGYYWCAKMPFGLTGAPSTFADMTAYHLSDLLAESVMELFVDDGGSADDDFDGMFAKLSRILQRVRERNLSLSAAKSEFFVSHGIFAGAKVSRDGVTVDPAKLTAIVDWKRPADALNLASFVGLTGHFRDLIRNYARIEGPLRNLLKSVPLPKNYTKSTYRRAMESFKLDDRWGEEHTKAFLGLKRALVSEPVLKAPAWDGSNFIITTDGCKEGFAAVVAQRFETVLPNGVTVSKIHPVGFASKRTSISERNYKPFLLEFAALKFGLDKFSDMIWGSPVEIETDCQALRDVLVSDKMNAAHARWRDGILAHQIVDVCHIPGKMNVVADGLSRMWEGQDRVDGDGSEWNVSEDWEAVTGLVNDVFGVEEASRVLSVEADNGWRRLRKRFEEEMVFLEVLEALETLEESSDEKAKQRARHKAGMYMVEDGKLWKVGGNEGIRSRARVECVTKKEAVELARKQHGEGGHWGRDATKLALMDVIWSPKLDDSIMQAIAECPECKSFGSPKLHALLYPITRRHPFELLVGDYLSLAKGKGGYKTVGLYLDTYSQRVWAHKFKVAGSGSTTNSSLTSIFNGYLPSETFMTDGGSHFDNEAVDELCESWGVKHHVVSAYSPWVNGLVEGTNKILLHVLKRLCAPKLGEDSEEFLSMTWETLPTQWPDHLDDAIRILNNRILPAFKFTPNELLLGAVVNTRRSTLEESTSILPPGSVAVQAAYVAQQQLDGYEAMVRHAVKRKSVFDRRLLKKEGREVVFEKGDLVQVYRSDLDYTFKAIKKTTPKWSRPYRVVERNVNSYLLETTEGRLIEGKEFAARRLRGFTPRPGTRLALQQEEILKKRESGES